jgi:hypothetical protein
MVNIGRALVNIPALLVVVFLYFFPVDILPAGLFTYLPNLALILLVVLAIEMIVDFAFVGGWWTSFVLLGLGALVLQNWLLGLIISVIHLIAWFTVGKKLGGP